MEKAKEILNDLLVDVFNHILSIEGQVLKDNGVHLSMNEVHVLEAIEKTEDPTMTNISKRLRVTLGTLTTAMNRLVEKGYVKRKRKKEDKRIVLISLTAQAKDVLKAHDKFHNEMIEATIKDLEIDKNEELIESLKNIRDYFNRKY
ncbi:MAG: MarR family winged helix-turn-helix transcriptional regulator [Candidatus Izimaplasma sp.]|nr:MarR family winged helix-turn-helix transcriptional regulator [Candidatus Izimaplasma bacterium]